MFITGRGNVTKITTTTLITKYTHIKVFFLMNGTYGIYIYNLSNIVAYDANVNLNVYLNINTILI